MGVSFWGQLFLRCVNTRGCLQGADDNENEYTHNQEQASADSHTKKKKWLWMCMMSIKSVDTTHPNRGALLSVLFPNWLRGADGKQGDVNIDLDKQWSRREFKDNLQRKGPCSPEQQQQQTEQEVLLWLVICYVASRLRV